MASTSKCRELEWELQHIHENTLQAEQAHMAALQATQATLTAAEAASHRFEQDAAKLRDSADRAHSEAACLAQDLAEAKVSLVDIRHNT